MIGHVCIDANMSENAVYEGWGSAVLYMNQYYRQHGRAHPTVISSYGPDMLNYLPAVTMLPDRPNRHSTLRYQNDNTKARRIQHCFNVASSRPPAISAEIKAVVRRADIIIVATLLPNYRAAYLRELFGYATSKSLKVLCPQGYFRHIDADGLVSPIEFAEAGAILPLFDLAVYSEEDHPRALELARSWERTYRCSVVVTQAASGAVIFDNDARQHVTTTPIPGERIIDSVGCGDTFAAAVALDYCLTDNLAAAVQAAHKIAANKLLAVSAVSRTGAQ